jgi:hypothetical protein
MLCGEVHQRERSMRALGQELASLAQRIESLDTTMALFDTRLNPQAGGTVRAIAGKYGRYGGLTEFLQQQLGKAGAEGLDTKTLTERAASYFVIDLGVTGSWKRFKDTVLWTLRNLSRKGLVGVQVVSRGGHTPQRWRSTQRVQIADLLASQEYREPHPDAFGPEVATQ